MLDHKDYCNEEPITVDFNSDEDEVGMRRPMFMSSSQRVKGSPAKEERLPPDCGK